MRCDRRVSLTALLATKRCGQVALSVLLLTTAASLSGCGGTETRTVTVTETRTIAATPDVPAATTTAQTTAPAVTDPVEERQRFYTRLDNQAVALSQALEDELDGQNRRTALRRLKRTIVHDVNAWVTAGHEGPVAFSELISAAADAKVADDTATLMRVRDDVEAIRARLAAWVAKGA